MPLVEWEAEGIKKSVRLTSSIKIHQPVWGGDLEMYTWYGLPEEYLYAMKTIINWARMNPPRRDVQGIFIPDQYGQVRINDRNFVDPLELLLSCQAQVTYSRF